MREGRRVEGKRREGGRWMIQRGWSSRRESRGGGDEEGVRGRGKSGHIGPTVGTG